MPKEMPLISVVVPVYETEKYLGRCLDSILNQTYKNIELIVVNDASKDDSEKIIKDYMFNYGNIRYICHKKNRGLFQARLSGIEEAGGLYIAFVDSDDYISCDWFRILVEKSLQTDADITVGDWSYEFEDNKRLLCNLDNFRIKDVFLEGDRVFDCFMKQHGECFPWHTVWNKLYKKDLWDKSIAKLVEFSTKREHMIMCEDLVFSSALWSNANKVVNTHGAFYFYYQHKEQSVFAGDDMNKFKSNIMDVKYAFDFFETVSDDKGYKEDYNCFKSLYARRWYDICTDMKQKEEALELYDIAFEDCGHEHTKDSDHFWGKQLTELGPEFNWLEQIKRKLCDEDVEYVSFDVFDTLVVRPFWEPSDIFDLMSSEFNKKLNTTSFVDFKEIRISSENEARKLNEILYEGIEDITIDDIYQYMNDKYCIASDVCMEMKELELNLELRFCNVRRIGKSLFELAKLYNKKIIVVSDMYLKKEFIKKMLDKNGYTDIFAYYISSESRLLKGSGGLFKYVLRDLKIEDKSSIIHIGDNWNADVVASNKVGIQSYHLPKAKDIFLNQHSSIFGGESIDKIFNYLGTFDDRKRCVADFIGIRCMLAVVANKMYDEGYVTINRASDFNCNPYFAGYFALGMHLLSITDWMVNESVKNNYKNIHFVARDGWLPKRAFDIYAEHYNLDTKSNYFYTSRKVTAPLQIRKVADLYSLRSIILIYTFSPKKLIEILKEIIDTDAYNNAEKICFDNKFLYEKNFTSEREFNRFIKFFSESFLSLEKADDYSKIVLNYFDNIIGENDAFFDIGYSARNEGIFSYLLENKKINTYYIHINQDIAVKRSKMFDFNIHCFYDYGPASCVVLREHNFCELGPSCVSYSIKDNEVVPVFEDYDVDYKTYFVTKTLQDASLDFVSDFINIFDDYYDCMIYRRHDASLPYEYFLHEAKWFDRQMYSESSFEDDMWGGANVNFVSFWEDNLKSAGCYNNINEKFPKDKIDHKSLTDDFLEYFNKRRKDNEKNKKKEIGFFMDKISDEDDNDTKFAKCAGNTSNLVEWDAIKKFSNPTVIKNWFMSNPGGFKDNEYDIFLMTNLIWVEENTDLTYLDNVLKKIGNNKILLPIGIGFTAAKEKKDFKLSKDSIRTLASIAERCVSVGVRGEYSCEVLNNFGIKNTRIIGASSIYSIRNKISHIKQNPEQISLVNASFKPFYGNLSAKEQSMLKFFEENNCAFTDSTKLNLSKDNISDDNMYNKIKSFESKKNVFFDVDTWKNSFEKVDFAMGMNFNNNVMALASGVPALFVNYESIGRELCKYYKLPCIDISEFEDNVTMMDYYKLADYTDFKNTIDLRCSEFSDFLKENGLIIKEIENRIVEK